MFPISINIQNNMVQCKILSPLKSSPPLDSILELSAVCVLSAEIYVCVQEGDMQWQMALWQSEVTPHSSYWNTTNNFPVIDHLSS